MKVVHSLSDPLPIERPVALTIGVYDGLHIGHQMIFKALRKESKKGYLSVVLTFSNHPSSYLTPQSHPPLLISFEHRLHLLKLSGVAVTIALPFDQSIANQMYQDFFKMLCRSFPIAHLIVGEGARFGKNREGGLKEIEKLKWFPVKAIPKKRYREQLISSSVIRFYLNKGDLKMVKKLLGRSYSLRLPFDQNEVIQEDQKQWRWMTWRENVCLLPSAVYGVDLQTRGKKVSAIAIYRAIHSIHFKPRFELTLIFETPRLNATEIEVIFNTYLHDDLENAPLFSLQPPLLKLLKPQVFPL